MLLHRNKEKVKMTFDVNIVKVSNLDKKYNGSTLFVEWKRGSRKNSSSTKRAFVSKNEAFWGDSFQISTHLYKEKDKDKFDSKTLTLTLKEVGFGNINSDFLKGPPQIA